MPVENSQRNVRMLINIAHNLLPLRLLPLLASDHLQYANTKGESLGDWSCEVTVGGNGLGRRLQSDGVVRRQAKCKSDQFTDVSEVMLFSMQAVSFRTLVSHFRKVLTAPSSPSNLYASHMAPKLQLYCGGCTIAHVNLNWNLHS